MWVLVGLAWARYFALSLPTAAAAAAAGEAPVARAGFFPRCAACWGSRRGRPRRWRGPPGPRSQLLARPPRSPLLLWRPPVRRPWPVRGPSPAFAACWGPRRGRPRRWQGRLGSRPQPLARPPRSPSLLWRPPARRPWPVRGPSPAFAACRGSRRGRPRRWRGPPGPRSQPLARPSRSPLRLRQPSAMRLVPAPGLPPVSAACRGPRSGPRRGLLGLRSPLPASLGPPTEAGRRGLLLGRRGRSPRLAQAPGPGAAARPAPPPLPASAPRAPRGSPPSTPGRRWSGSGTGGGGGRLAGGSHRSLPSLLSW